MIEVIGVRFKKKGKVYYFSPEGKAIPEGECVIVSTARGIEFGDVVIGNTFITEERVIPPLKSVLRIATDEDKAHLKDNIRREQEAYNIFNEKVKKHGLDMKLVEVEYTFDNNKILFYFTADGRVDFRDLVKDLASVFRTRIELRQIGVRDEAKMIGGLGICGRGLCCSTFLNEFLPVSIKMAKEQSFSLNPSKISGLCGRFMCCLRFEQEAYEDLIAKTPRIGARVSTPEGEGIVTEIALIIGEIKVRLDSNPEAPPKCFNRAEVETLHQPQAGDTQKSDENYEEDNSL